MPRISPSVVRKASSRDPLLGLLLPACRTLEQAEVELGWIRREVPARGTSVSRACQQRSQLVPLQYVLGSQPFGPLDILCRNHVLIPRWETEEWSCDLADRLKRVLSKADKFAIWDLCTGTGCIALLMRHELRDYQGVSVCAVDCSSHAIALAAKNMEHNKLADVGLMQRDILKQVRDASSSSSIDLLICNPPYIPRETFVKDTATSVKLYEPRLALVGDKEFYKNLVCQWLQRTNSFVYEIGDMDQCNFVKSAVQDSPRLRRSWSLGLKTDSNGKPRVIYGFKKSFDNLRELFHGFGEVILI